jgi:hypothetical protein
VFTQAGGLLKASIAVAFPSLLSAALVLRLAEHHILKTTERVRALSDAEHTLPANSAAALPR